MIKKEERQHITVFSSIFSINKYKKYDEGQGEWASNSFLTLLMLLADDTIVQLTNIQDHIEDELITFDVRRLEYGKNLTW